MCAVASQPSLAKHAMTARATKRHDLCVLRAAADMMLVYPVLGNLGCIKLLGNNRSATLLSHRNLSWSKDVLAKKPKEYWDYEKMIDAWTCSSILDARARCPIVKRW